MPVAVRPDQYGAGVHQWICTCDTCGREISIRSNRTISNDLVAARAREYGWVYSCERLRYGRYETTCHCPRHLLASPPIRRTLQFWETSYLVGDLFTVGPGHTDQSIRLNPRMGVLQSEARKGLRRTRNTEWGRYKDDITASAFGMAPFTYYEQSLVTLGLYPIRKKSALIHRQVRGFHLWAAQKWPGIGLQYDRELLQITGVSATDVEAIQQRLQIPRSRLEIQLKGVSVQVDIRRGDLELQLTGRS